MTLPSSLYYLTHPFTKERVYAPKTFEERKPRRALLLYYKEENRELVVSALKHASRHDFIHEYLRSLHPQQRV